MICCYCCHKMLYDCNRWFINYSLWCIKCLKRTRGYLKAWNNLKNWHYRYWAYDWSELRTPITIAVLEYPHWNVVRNSIECRFVRQDHYEFFRLKGYTFHFEKVDGSHG